VNAKTEMMDDNQLVKSFRSGDQQAFNALVIRWQPRIHRFAYRFFADSDDASEITQKTFIKAYQNLGSLENEAKFSSWLYRIANNLCLDELKRSGRRKSSPLEAWMQSSEMAAEMSPAQELEHAELGAMLQKALLAIPDEQRTVVLLKEYEGLTFREIAEVLEVSENTVKSRMYYGLKALRKVFKKWKIDTEVKYDD
jgi:RNA polymerase sigma-70 factor (ECF subfamily)